MPKQKGSIFTMLDINMLRKTPDVVRENMKKKFQDAKL